MSVNALRLGDTVEVNPYHPADFPDTRWLGRVKAFRNRSVLVEALDRSDDPLVDNEQPHPFDALTFVSREEPDR